MESYNLVNIVPSNGLSPVLCQAITWTHTDLLSARRLATTFNEIRIRIHYISYKKMYFDYVACIVSPILFRLQCINLHGSVASYEGIFNDLIKLFNCVVCNYFSFINTYSQTERFGAPFRICMMQQSAIRGRGSVSAKNTHWYCNIVFIECRKKIKLDTHKVELGFGFKLLPVMFVSTQPYLTRNKAVKPTLIWRQHDV